MLSGGRFELELEGANELFKKLDPEKDNFNETFNKISETLKKIEDWCRGEEIDKLLEKLKKIDGIHGFSYSGYLLLHYRNVLESLTKIGSRIYFSSKDEAVDILSRAINLIEQLAILQNEVNTLKQPTVDSMGIQRLVNKKLNAAKDYLKEIALTQYTLNNYGEIIDKTSRELNTVKKIVDMLSSLEKLFRNIEVLKKEQPGIGSASGLLKTIDKLIQRVEDDWKSFTEGSQDNFDPGAHIKKTENAIEDLRKAKPIIERVDKLSEINFDSSKPQQLAKTKLEEAKKLLSELNIDDDKNTGNFSANIEKIGKLLDSVETLCSEEMKIFMSQKPPLELGFLKHVKFDEMYGQVKDGLVNEEKLKRFIGETKRTQKTDDEYFNQALYKASFAASHGELKAMASSPR